MVPNVKMNETRFNLNGFMSKFYVNQQKYAKLYKACKFDDTLGHIIIRVSTNVNFYTHLSSTRTTSSLPDDRLTVVKNICQAESAGASYIWEANDNIFNRLNNWDTSAQWNVVTT